ncbi:MAG TPA: hypothetical protein PL110_17285 [Candidatus Eremiobacteraeota bacterium]|nr:hypothetical protein [Candidatus Eremiobacteraeota bacterium]
MEQRIDRIEKAIEELIESRNSDKEILARLGSQSERINRVT